MPLLREGHFWGTSIRRQLILGVALVHAVLMSIFVFDQVDRQRAFLVEQAAGEAQGLALTLAASSTSWVLANDLSGMEEMLRPVHDYPNLRYAMLISPKGQVLAHSDGTRVGQYLVDQVSLGLLREGPESRLLVRDAQRLDAVAPIRTQGRLLGWARVGLGMESVQLGLERILRQGFAYAGFAILAGVLFAWVLARGLTRGLIPLVQASNRLSRGESMPRLPVTRIDEIGALTADFNRMVEALELRDRALRENEERLRAIHDSVREAIVTIDESGVIESVNRAAERMFGYPAAELLGRNVGMLLPEPGSDLPACHLPGDWSHELGQSRELMGRRREGELFPVELNVSRVEYGGHRAFTGLVRDLSEHKRAEAERERLQRQLQQSQKLEAIGQLTGGIAHDFNNILGSILGYTELALNRQVPDPNSKLADYLRQIRTAGLRARDLIVKMLAFARGGGSDPQVLDPVPLVVEVARMLESALPASIELSLVTEGAIPPIRIDPVQLHQLVTNLCINARDAMEGSGEIEISLRLGSWSDAVCSACHEPLEGEFVELRVSDDGSGIPPELMPRIFDPFFTTKEVGKGTGLGLSMVHGIVHEHGGHVQVESRPGAGTRFHLLFPPIAAEAPVAGPVAGPEREALPPSSGKVLIVDDEAPLARLLGETLEAAGYQVSVHSDSRRALYAFAREPDAFVAAITDQTMPGLTGLELTQALHVQRPQLPVLMCSGFSEQIDAEHATAHGVRRFFQKPVVLAELLRVLGEECSGCGVGIRKMHNAEDAEGR